MAKPPSTVALTVVAIVVAADVVLVIVAEVTLANKYHREV